MCRCFVLESHKENSQPDVQRVDEDDVTKPSSLVHTHRTPSSPAIQSNKDHAVPVKRPSIFGSVALLAESSSQSVGHRLPSSASPFAVASRVDAATFATPPYTPRTRSQSSAVTPLAGALSLPQQPAPPPHVDDLSSSLMTPPSVMTVDQRPRAIQMTYTPPFTPVRPATSSTTVGRPRSRLSLNCPSPLQNLTRPPVGSLAQVSIVQISSCQHKTKFFFVLGVAVVVSSLDFLRPKDVLNFRILESGLRVNCVEQFYQVDFTISKRA